MKSSNTLSSTTASHDISGNFLRNSSFLLSVIVLLIVVILCSTLLFLDANRIKDDLSMQLEKIESVKSRLNRIVEIIPLRELDGHQSSVVNLIEDGINYQVNDLSNAIEVAHTPSLGKMILYHLSSKASWFDEQAPPQQTTLLNELMSSNRAYQSDPNVGHYTDLLDVTNRTISYIQQRNQTYNQYVNQLPFQLMRANAFIFLAICILLYLLWFQNMRRVVKQLQERNAFLKDQAKQLDYLAYNDVVTAAKNRQFFTRSINTMVANNDGKLPFSVIHVDVNRFKLINDSYGHKAGDFVLQTVSRVLVKHFPNNAVSRTGADEFLIIDQHHDRAALEKILNKIVDASAEPMAYNGQVINTVVNVGVAKFPRDGRTISELLKNLQEALNEAKKHHAGEGGVIFHEDMDFSKTNLPMPSYIDLTNAISDDEFVVFYSPQFDVETMRIIGAEALLRWRHPRFGGINTEHLIKVAEQMGLIARITDVVLADVTSLHTLLFSEFNRHFKLSINYSGGAREIDQQIKSTLATLKKHPSLSRHLVVEITEKVIFGTRGIELSDRMESLRKAGVGISLDDFGTGFASLTHLMEIKFDALKIDRSFVKDMLTSDTANKIVRSMVSLGRALDKEVVAEGIEDTQHLEALHALGCKTGQGYLVSKPIPKADFIALLRDQYPQML